MMQSACLLRVQSITLPAGVELAEYETDAALVGCAMLAKGTRKEYLVTIIFLIICFQALVQNISIEPSGQKSSESKFQINCSSKISNRNASAPFKDYNYNRLLQHF